MSTSLLPGRDRAHAFPPAPEGIHAHAPFHLQEAPNPPIYPSPVVSHTHASSPTSRGGYAHVPSPTLDRGQAHAFHLSPGELFMQILC